MSTDRIRLSGVRARGHHGVLAHEKADGQDFVVDVVLDLDLQAAGVSDDLAATVSYAEVAAEVVTRIEGPALDLIETLAEQIAADVLRRPRVDAVTVTVHKPQAPVGVPFVDVAVEVTRRRDATVAIALGANLGDAATTLDQAVAQLRRRGLEVTGRSRLYATAPVGGPAQPDYVNAVLTARTDRSPWSLLTLLHEVEAAAGRTREVRWGPRTLDLDLLQYGDPSTGDDVRLDDPALTLPHPRAGERAFVLVPWVDADPAATLRVGEEVRAVRDLVAALPEIDRAGVALHEVSS